jgi:3-hydroxybutyryl-CoA dehydrogenase
VEVVDLSPDALKRGRDVVERLVRRNAEKGRQTQEEADATLGRLNLSGDLDLAAPRCDWAIEAVVERLDVKQAVFAELVKLLPGHAGIATNSSHMRAATIVGDAEYRERALNMHFFHPVVVMDLVEIVASPHTSREVVKRAVAWADRMRRTSVVLTKDVDGFLVNRILGAASREAFSLYADGVTDVAQIDIAVERGLRWPIGPFKLADLSGLDVLLDTRSDRFAKYGDEADRKTIEAIRPLVAAGRLGRKSGAGFYDYSTDPPTPLGPPPASGTE